eukprot:394085-Hanusia_phi.AAC.2
MPVLRFPDPHNSPGAQESSELELDGREAGTVAQLPNSHLEVVLHDPLSRKVVVWDNQRQLAQVQNLSPCTRHCPYCNRPLPNNATEFEQSAPQADARYVSPRYFGLLSAHLQQSTDDEGSDGEEYSRFRAGTINLALPALPSPDVRSCSEEPKQRDSNGNREEDGSRGAASACGSTGGQQKSESESHPNINDIPPSSGVNALPSESLNVGYYARFFRQVRRIGTGAYGSVFECRHVMDGVHLGTFAVKIAPVGDNRQWLHKVLREVRNLQFLSHSNVVRYMHSWLEPHQSSPFAPMVPCLFILMEYANSGNLHSLLALDLPQRKRGFLSEDQIYLYTIDICSGLQYLHSMDIVHRDLKPENILVQSGRQSDSGIDIGHRLMISDLGQSQRLSENRGASRRSGCTGTVRYTAPEMLEVMSSPPAASTCWLTLLSRRRSFRMG